MTTGRRIRCTSIRSTASCPGAASSGRCRAWRSTPRTPRNWASSRATGCWIESKWGKIRQTADLCHGVKPGVVNLEHTWWYPELKQADKGYGLSCCNCLVNKDAQDPICGSSQLRAYPVKVYKATPENSPFGSPCPCGEDGTPIIADSSDPRLKEWLPVYEGREE